MSHRTRSTGAGTGTLLGALLLGALLAAGPVSGQNPGQNPGPTLAQDGAAIAGLAPSFAPPLPPSLNLYGSPGLMDMPSGEALPDGQFTTGVGYFGGQLRYTMSFQALPWVSASFRYNGIRNLNLYGFSTYYDRSFDARFRLHRETRRWPEITLGLQDFAGTGIYSAEYIVATKNFVTPGWGRASLPGRLKLTAGLGWGRLGSYGAIGSTFGARPAYNPAGTGGQLAFDQWFRGPVAPFGGIEWQPDDRWGLKLEYSSDAYVTETRTSNVFKRRSPFNFGVEYQATPRTRLGAYYMYGSEFGLTAQIQLNPRNTPAKLRVPAPQPVHVRPPREENPVLWGTEWADYADAPVRLSGQLGALLADQGVVVESLRVDADSAELRIRNLQYHTYALAIGRAARAMARALPASVETFHIVPLSGGMALSRATLRRSDLEALEFDGNAAAALLAVTGFSDAPPLSGDAVAMPGLYPDKSWSLAPYFQPSYFDPSVPFRLDVGLDLRGTWRPAPGWIISGLLRQRLAGNVKDGRASTSVLPHVRTDAVKYAQYGTTMQNLFAAYQWRPGRDLYGRVTAGYLEQMYAGLSGELLWKPVSSRLALGVEANYVRQRDYDQRLDLLDYTVATGHVSAYYEFGPGLIAQVDIGRYLAGDVGATFAIDRVFDNGWSVGGFFTKTDVSAAEFGEGSFDKGIRFSIPLTWFLGTESRQSVGTTIRPITRDGGARLNVPGRLYGQVRNAHYQALSGQWARAWE